MKKQKKSKKEAETKSLTVVFTGPDENLSLDEADFLFAEDEKIINKKAKNYKEAYSKMNFLFELICFMHGVHKQFDKTVINKFAKKYPQILTIKENEHIYYMNYLLILFYKYNACYIEDDGHIVIDNSVFDELRKFYKRKININRKVTGITRRKK